MKVLPEGLTFYQEPFTLEEPFCFKGSIKNPFLRCPFLKVPKGSSRVDEIISVESPNTPNNPITLSEFYKKPFR